MITEITVSRDSSHASAQALERFAKTARLTLGTIWVYEGIIPKLLFPKPSEIALVRDSGMWLRSPAFTLRFIAAAEIIGGLWLLTGHARKMAAASATVVMLLLTLLIAHTRPQSLADPLGGLEKNAALALLAWIIIKTPHKGERYDFNC